MGPIGSGIGYLLQQAPQGTGTTDPINAAVHPTWPPFKVKDDAVHAWTPFSVKDNAEPAWSPFSNKDGACVPCCGIGLNGEWVFPALTIL